MSLSREQTALLQQLKALCDEPLQELASDLNNEIEAAFNQAIDQATNNQLRMDAMGYFRTFNKHKLEVKSHFHGQLISGFDAFQHQALSTIVDKTETEDTLSLVDDQVLEDTIAISSQSNQIHQEYLDKLWQLNQRLTVINDESTVDDSNNPLSPIQFFVAQQKANETCHIPTAGKMIIYKALTNQLHKHYPPLLNKANAFFISQGILPEIRYEAGNHSGITSPSQEQDIEQTVEAETVGNSKEPSSQTPPTKTSTSGGLVNTIRNLLKKTHHVNNDEANIPIAEAVNSESVATSSGPMEGSSPRHIETHPSQSRGLQTTGQPVIFSEIEIVSAVDDIQKSAATAHFFSERPDSENLVIDTPTNIAENSARVYDQLYKQSPDGAISAKNMYTIDMVGMLFEYILSDESLPDSIKTLLSHLHTPYLKLAFMDDDFFDNEHHSSRLLLDSLADAGASWVNHDGTAQYDMYNEIKRVVQRVVKDFTNDTSLFRELLSEFNRVKQRASHMHSLRERNSIEKKQGQEKHEQAKTLARQEIKQRIEGRKVPSSIISLLSPWFSYLTYIYLRQGRDSETWNKALSVIDHLIMYSSIKEVKQDTNSLTKGFDQIIQYIEEGLSLIAYHPKKTSDILAELEELKDNIVNKKKVKTTLTPVDSKNTSDKPENSPSEEEEKVMNYIKLIEPGTWIEHNREHRLKVSGFNTEVDKYALIDQTSKEVVLLSRLEFARDILAGTKKIIDGSAKPLFERALERIHNNLDKQVHATG